jgi:hypothetical protein
LRGSRVRKGGHEGADSNEREGLQDGRAEKRGGEGVPGGHPHHDRDRPGWRSNGFRMGGGHEAYDAELAAVVYALVHFHGRDQEGHDYTIFTDSVAAMRRMMGDAPGPGQDMAIGLSRSPSDWCRGETR